MNRRNTEGAWRPLLTGSAAERAQEVVAAIARATAKSEEWQEGPSIAAGQAGVALFHAYLHAAEPEAGHDERGLEWLDGAIATLTWMSQRPQLYGGYVGIAWVTEHLRGRAWELEEGDEDPNEEIDPAVRDLLGTTPWKDDYDLIFGLVGHGVYALERLPRPAAAESLARLLDRLEETAERGPRGITWYTPYELIRDRTRGTTGYYDLGVAHGMPGVIALLGELCAAGVEAERSRELLAGAVPWLLAHKEEGGDGSLFPSIAGPGTRSHRRLAWCYGDAGVAAALVLAGRGAGEPAWEAEGLAVARAAARRRLDGSGVVDAGLCHGSAGLAHIFNRLHQATGDEDLAEAARFWYGHALGFHRPGESAGGFLSWENPAPGEPAAWRGRPGFLTGSAGVGLALLAATTAVEPAWDRLLLTSVPPRSSTPAPGPLAGR